MPQNRVAWHIKNDTYEPREASTAFTRAHLGRELYVNADGCIALRVGCVSKEEA